MGLAQVRSEPRGRRVAAVMPQLLGEARQGILRLDIGEEKIGESELR